MNESHELARLLLEKAKGDQYIVERLAADVCRIVPLTNENHHRTRTERRAVAPGEADCILQGAYLEVLGDRWGRRQEPRKTRRGHRQSAGYHRGIVVARF